MRQIERRLKTLEKKHTPPPAGPDVIFICAYGGEPSAAILINRGHAEREPGETREAFEARIEELCK